MGNFIKDTYGQGFQNHLYLLCTLREVDHTSCPFFWITVPPVSTCRHNWAVPVLNLPLSLFLFAEKKMITRLACGHCLHFLMHMISLNQSSLASLPPTYFKEIILRKDTHGLHLVQRSGHILLFLISTSLEIINVSFILECWVCFANSHLSLV